MPGKVTEVRGFCKMLETFKKLIELIKGLVDNKFYGSLEIKFEAGKIVVCKKEESIKL